MTRVRVLFCDDRKSEREAFLRLVAEPGVDRFECETAASLDFVRERVRGREAADIVVTDLNFETVGGGPTDGLAILRECRERWPHVECVMLTAYPDSLLPRQVLEAASYGITRDTWLSKIEDDPAKIWTKLGEVLRGLSRVIASRRERYEAEEASLAGGVRLFASLAVGPLSEVDRFPEFPEMVGRSPRLHEIWRQVRQVARAPVTVLLAGETGTGKELVAQAIHQLSGRAPLTSVNCSAFSEELLASELFGHARGAFTGAEEAAPGLLETTGEGTLFLDEIGEMSLANQARFLRVLQEREYRPVGTSQIRRTKARIVAATNRNLAAQVQAGQFRADLYGRLNVYRIEVPPLRERREDVPPAAIHYLDRISRRLGRRVEGVTEAALWKLVRHDWPENMRELINVLTRALINLPAGRRVLDEADLDLATFERLAGAAAPAAPEGPEGLWQQLLSGVARESLPELARRHGKPAALDVVRLAMLHYCGLPPEEETQRLFGMSYRNWQHWAHYNGLTWEKVRAERGSAPT